MAPTDVLRAANAIVGSLGVAPANPAFAGAASGLSAAFSMQEIWRRLTGKTDTMAGGIAADLSAQLQDTRLYQAVQPPLAPLSAMQTSLAGQRTIASTKRSSTDWPMPAGNPSAACCPRQFRRRPRECTIWRDRQPCRHVVLNRAAWLVVPSISNLGPTGTASRSRRRSQRDHTAGTMPMT